MLERAGMQNFFGINNSSLVFIVTIGDSKSKTFNFTMTGTIPIFKVLHINLKIYEEVSLFKRNLSYECVKCKKFLLTDGKT